MVRAAVPSVVGAALVAWLLAVGLDLSYASLGLRRPSVAATAVAWTPLVVLVTPLGRRLLTAALLRRPALVAGLVAATTWAGCLTVLVPEAFPVAGAGVAHFALQLRPHRRLLGLLLGVLAVGTAAVVLATTAGGLPSLVPAPAGDVLVVGLLALVTQQVTSSLRLARAAQRSARSLVEREDERLRELQLAATHDPLTGALNRRGLFEELQAALAAPGCGTAVVFLDLDGFKGVNDAHGHDVGDELLVALAHRLRTALRQPPRQADLLARLGGDEFVAVLAGVPSPAVAERVAERLRAAVTAPVATSAGEVRVGVSAGTVHSTGPLTGPVTCAAESLLRAADALMYAEKRTRREGAARRGAPQGREELRPPVSAG